LGFCGFLKKHKNLGYLKPTSTALLHVRLTVLLQASTCFEALNNLTYNYMYIHVRYKRYFPLAKRSYFLEITIIYHFRDVTTFIRNYVYSPRYVVI